jgi:hypothetical protein
VGEYGAANNSVTSSWFDSNVYGIYQDNSQSVDNSYITDTFGSNTSYGLYANNGSLWVKNSSAIDDGMNDFYVSNLASWVSFDDVEIEQSGAGAVPMNFPAGNRAWPTLLRDVRIDEGLTNGTILTYAQQGPLSFDHCRFEGNNLGTNNVTVGGNVNAVNLFDLNTQYLSGAVLNRVQPYSGMDFVNGVQTAWPHSISEGLAFRVDRNNQVFRYGYGFYSQGLREGAIDFYGGTFYATQGNDSVYAALEALTFQSTVATGTPPLTVASTTPVANLAATPTTYNGAGTQATNVHLVKDTCTLGTNCSVRLSASAAFTSSTSYDCWARDATTPANAVRVTRTSGSAIAFTGSGTDVINFLCAGD